MCVPLHWVSSTEAGTLWPAMPRKLSGSCTHHVTSGSCAKSRLHSSRSSAHARAGRRGQRASHGTERTGMEAGEAAVRLHVGGWAGARQAWHGWGVLCGDSVHLLVLATVNLHDDVVTKGLVHRLAGSVGGAARHSGGWPFCSLRSRMWAIPLRRPWQHATVGCEVPRYHGRW